MIKVFWNVSILENQVLDQIAAVLEADTSVEMTMLPRTVNDEEYSSHRLSENSRFFLLREGIGCSNRAYYRLLFKVLSSGAYDIVDSKMLQSTESLVAAVAKVCGKYYHVCNLYGGERHYYMKGRMTLRSKVQLRISHISADFCIANDKTLEATTLRLDPCKPAMLLYNSVDVNRFCKIPKIANEVPVVFFNHRMIPVKRPMIFWHAVDRLMRSGVDFRVLVVGPRRENSELGRGVKEFIQHRGLGQIVEWIDRRVSASEMDGLYSRSDITVNMSELIVPSLATLEAMASGIPAVIADELDSDKYVQDGINGFVIEPSVSALVESLACLIANNSLREQMGQVARDHSLLFDIRLWAKTYVSVYKHTLNYEEPLRAFI